MQLLLHIIVLFVFVLALISFNILKIPEDNYLKQKLYIFVGIFIFEFLVNIFITINKKCVVDIRVVLRNSFQSALIAIVAYAVYNDLVLSSNFMIVKQNTKFKKNLAITIIITGFITLGYFFDVLIFDSAPGMNDCLNKIYGK